LIEAGLGLKYLNGYKGTWGTEFWNALGKDAQYILADGFWSETYPYPKARELGERYYQKFNKSSVSIGLFYAICQAGRVNRKWNRANRSTFNDSRRLGLGDRRARQPPGATRAPQRSKKT